MLPIWKLSPTEYYLQEKARHALTLVDNGNTDERLVASGWYTAVHKEQIKDAQTRARVVLSLAILSQVSSLVLSMRPAIDISLGCVTMELGNLPVLFPVLQPAGLQRRYHPRHLHGLL